MLPIHRIVLVSVFLPGLTAGHSPLLPKPQKIHYDSGQLPLKSLSIRLAPDAADEDRFAAAELSRILSARCQTSVPIADAATPSILLKRTGPVAALPVPDEKPGPDSRESYQLKITSAGGEVDACASRKSCTI